MHACDLFLLSSFRFLFESSNQNQEYNTKKYENGHLKCLLGVIDFGILFAHSFLSDQNNKTKTKNERNNGLGIEPINIDLGSCTAISLENKEY